jgi:outer membrane protein TolC
VVCTSAGSAAPASDADEAALAQQADLETILRLALARHPSLGEAGERVLASRERQAAAGRLPDLELRYEEWGVPLGRPYALDEAGTLMLGLGQTFPARGSRAAAARMAAEEAGLAAEDRRARAQEVATRARQAFYQYAGAEQEYALHLEQIELTHRLVELARTNYQAGRGTQQDVLRLILEVSRLHGEVAPIEQRQRSARALLNTLMVRPPAAPLGSPPPLAPSPVEPRLEQLSRDLETNRPELAAAARAVLRGQAALDAAQSEARWPALMLSTSYWLQPTSEERHAYGLMVSVNLPWLNEKRRAEVRAAEHGLAAARLAREAERLQALYQIEDAAARLDAARDLYTILETDTLPQARRSFEAARTAYASGNGDALALLDALRSVLQTRIEQIRALVRLESSLADLERAAGVVVTELSDKSKGDQT